MTSRSRLRSILAGTAAVALAVSLTLFVSPAQADPKADQPTTVAEAKALVEKLNTEAAAIDQDYAAAEEKVAASKKKLAQQKSDLAVQQKKVDRMREQVATFALATYQRRGTSSTAAFLGGTDSEFFSRISTIQQISANQVTELQKFQAEQANLDGMKLSAEAEVAVKAKAETDMADARERSQAKIAEAKKVLSRLTAAERARIAAEEAREAEQARAAAARAAAEAEAEADAAPTRTATTRTSRDEDRGGSTTTSKPKKSDPAPNVPVSGRAAAAVAFAKAQVGKPYSYGATGPGSYDCSGLTGAAWRSAGVGLPRTSQAQFGAGRSVSTSNLQPGDLVFYYSGISHVGIYVGGGQIVDAANPRSGVRYAGLHSMPLMGARRPG